MELDTHITPRSRKTPSAFGKAAIKLYYGLRHRQVQFTHRYGNAFPKSGFGFEQALIRILGNDHYPRHGRGQTLDNLKFILTNEPPFPGCRKVFLLNRIVDRDMEAELVDTLESHRMDYVRIPFVAEEYRRTGWDLSAFGGIGFFGSDVFAQSAPVQRMKMQLWATAPKIRYVMNVNGARNAALEVGRTSADWTFVLDGNCCFTESQFAALARSCRNPPHLPYMIVPMVRINDNREYFDGSLRFSLAEEPQIGFHYLTRETFDERYPYGVSDKAHFLKKLGLPGAWLWWGGESYMPEDAGPSPVRYRYKISEGGVVRLSSGSHGLAEDRGKDRNIRYHGRNAAILNTIAHMEKMFGEPDDPCRDVILGDYTPA